MAMTLALTVEQVEKLRQAILPHCVEADVVVALGRYPGKLGRADVFPNEYTLAKLIASCLDVLQHEKDYFSRSFMLRLIEQKWDTEAVRRRVVEAVPEVVRPPRGFDVQIAAVSSALDSLTSRIPDGASIGNIGDAAVFRQFCDARESVKAMVLSLQRFETLKEAHDGLHMLQVLGAPWLDAFAIDAPADHSGNGLITLLQRLKTVATTDPTILPTEAAESFARCLSASEDGERRIRTGDGGETAFACATLRALLIRELQLIDRAMFAISRDFPLREFCSLFPDEPALDVARDAAIDLADTLRRRLMEHSLWQSINMRVYALEQMLAIAAGDRASLATA